MNFVYLKCMYKNLKKYAFLAKFQTLGSMREVFRCNKTLIILHRCSFICNVRVKRTRPNAVDRLGCTTYRATLRVD